MNKMKWVLVNLVFLSCLTAYAQTPEQMVQPLMARMEGAWGPASSNAVRVQSTQPIFAGYQVQPAEDDEIPQGLLEPERPEGVEGENVEGSNSVAVPVLLGVAGATGVLALLAVMASLPWELTAVFGGIALVTGAVGLVLWLSQRNSKS